MKNVTFITRFKTEAKAKAREAEASRARILRVAEKLRGRELFPEKVARANEFLRRAALTDKRITVS